MLHLDYGKSITNLLYPDYGSFNGIQLFFKTRKFLLGLVKGKTCKVMTEIVPPVVTTGESEIRVYIVFISGGYRLWVSTRNHFFLFIAIGSEVRSLW